MNERRGQVLVGFRCDPALRKKIEDAAGGDRISQFLRDAVVAKLAALKLDVDPSLAKAPSRIGKGGPKKSPAKPPRKNQK